MHADLAIDGVRADENIEDYNPTRKPFIERALNILNSYNIDTNYLTPESQMIYILIYWSWTIYQYVETCTNLKRQEYQQEEMKSLFYEHLA